MLLVVPVLLAGCGAEPGTGRDAGEAPPTSPAEPSALLERYLEVFAVADAERLRSEWIPMTAPGSLARLYSEHHTTLRQAMEDGGTAPPREDTVETTGEGVQICTGEAFCRTYTEPAARDGLLTAFTVNDEPLAGHVVQPGAQSAAGGVTVRLVSGIETSRRALFLCLEATNAGGAPAWLEAASATYPGADGSAQPAAEAHGPAGPIAPGASAVACPVFQVGQPGGRLQVGVTSGPTGTTAPLELPVAAAPG